MGHYLHSINNKTHTEKINDSPEVLKPVTGRARFKLEAEMTAAFLSLRNKKAIPPTSSIWAT